MKADTCPYLFSDRSLVDFAMIIMPSHATLSGLELLRAASEAVSAMPTVKTNKKRGRKPTPGLSEEERKQARLLKNRRTAEMSRRRKLQHLQTLQHERDCAVAENARLRAENAALRARLAGIEPAVSCTESE